MIGFGLAPRINAAGRLEQAMMAVEMLTTTDVRAVARSRVRARSAATSGDRRSNARSLTKPRRCSRPRGAWATAGRSCWDDGLARGGDRHRRRPPGGGVSSADRDHLPGRRDLTRLGALDPGIRPVRSTQRLLGRTDRLRRPRRRGRAQAQLPNSFPIFARRFEERCKGSLSAEQLERVLDHRRGDSAGRLEPGGRRARSKSWSRTESPIPGRCSWRAASRSWASPVRSARRKTTFSSGSSRVTTSQGDRLEPRRKGTGSQAGSRLFDRVQPVDQRVERAPRGSA